MYFAIYIKHLSAGRWEERKEWTKSEMYLQHITFFEMLCFLSDFTVAYVFALLFTELYTNNFYFRIRNTGHWFLNKIVA